MIRRFTAIIAKTRSGKTYTIKGAIEEGLDAGDQIVVLDPTSAYYGLRLEADGKTPAYPDLLIIGVKHTTGTFGDDLSRMKRFGLIDYPTKGTARLEDWVRVLS
jgi:DNA helicase HerA-like ATPase